MPFEPLQTARLTLRRLADADLDALVAIRSDPAVVRYTPIRGFNADRGRALIAEMRAREPGTPGTWFQFALERRDTRAFIGEVGLRCEDGPRTPACYEIGFTLASSQHRQGFGEEAVRAVLGYAFGALGAHRVHGNCDARNTASAGLMAKVGMRREAHHLSDWWAPDFDVDGAGAWTDSLIYAVLDREWPR
jgi:RimJ/RimL family protein N-acetyltransferase